jgi:hypothetical protein
MGTVLNVLREPILLIQFGKPEYLTIDRGSEADIMNGTRHIMNVNKFKYLVKILVRNIVDFSEVEKKGINSGIRVIALLNNSVLLCINTLSETKKKNFILASHSPK